MERVGVWSISNGYIRAIFINYIQRNGDIYNNAYIYKNAFKNVASFESEVVYSCIYRSYGNGRKHRPVDMWKKESKFMKVKYNMRHNES